MFHFLSGFSSFISRVLWGEINSPSLFESIKSAPEPVVTMNFGLLGGQVAFVNPTNLDMAHLIDTLDGEPNGRRGETGLRFFVGGNFLSTRAKDDAENTALSHHHLLSTLLTRPADYIENTHQAMRLFLQDERREISLLELATVPLRNTVARGLFNIESIPFDLHQALQGFSGLIQDKLDSFGKTLSVKLMTAYYSWFFSFIPRYQQTKTDYLVAAEKFLAQQSDQIIQCFHTLMEQDKTGALPENLSGITNALARFVAQRVKETNPELAKDKNQFLDYLAAMTEADLQPYLHEATIKTLPILPLPGDMIVIPVSSALTELAKNQELLLQLRHELQQRKFAEKNSEQKRDDIMQDREHNGLLHRIYLESLRRDFQQKTPEHLEAETIILRYSEYGVAVKNKQGEIVNQVPPHTLIAILNALPRFDPKVWPNPEKFDPSRYVSDNDKTLENCVKSIFFYGKRKCPANVITEFIFQTFIADLVMNYDLRLIDGNDLAMAKIELTPISDLEHGVDLNTAVL
jgi:hypothetical protein